jgi:hypothetical protein
MRVRTSAADDGIGWAAGNVVRALGIDGYLVLRSNHTSEDKKQLERNQAVFKAYDAVLSSLSWGPRSGGEGAFYDVKQALAKLYIKAEA